MSPPFNNKLKKIADDMGIALYQRFTVNQASLFLRCREEDVQKQVKQGQIEHIRVAQNNVEFFGYQLLNFLLNSVVDKTTSIQHQSEPERIIRAKEVQEITGLSRTTLWRMENNGTFPRRVSLGVGSVGWRLSEVKRWITER